MLTSSSHPAAICPVAPSSPPTSSRPSRLRGLSYLRSYTHSHLLPLSNSLPTRSLSTSSPSGVGSPWLSSERAAPRPTAASAESESTYPGPNSDRTMVRERTATASALTSTLSRPTAPRRSSPRAQSRDNANTSSMAEAPSSAAAPPKEAQPTIRFIPHVEARGPARPSLHFTAMSRTLKTANTVVCVGRYSERDMSNPTANILPVGFKSKVVSRRHCEFWCTEGQWHVKDVKSSSGTFLNHVRLSPPGAESPPYPVHDGDVVQLGIDFKGGEEVIFRCVKIRIECNRGWQKSLNNFNTLAHNRILRNTRKNGNRDSDAASVHSSECSICLNPVAPCQALFVAPCSHVWHYKCVRNLIHTVNYPNFLCPNCRFVADLDADVEPPEENGDFDAFDDEELREQPPSPDNSELDDAQRMPSASSNERGEARHPAEMLARSNSAESEAGEVTTDIAGDETSETRRSASRPSASRSLTASHTGPTNTQDERSVSSTSTPVTIAPSSTSRSHSHDLLSARSTTPISSTQFALVADIISSDGPMTPRNDAGPYVLDGSAGIATAHGIDGTAAQAANERTSLASSPTDER